MLPLWEVVMHLLSASQFTADGLCRFFHTVDRPRIEYKGVMATLFYEPSTRTRMSFEAAMLRLGGSVISSDDPSRLSHAKGETLEDTVRTVGCFADVIVLRHPEVGAVARAAAVSPVPVINAGDGNGEHPTQALLDAYLIDSRGGKRVCLCGDLKNGRTAHSLVRLLALFPGIKLSLVSPGQLPMPEELLTGMDVRTYGSLTAAIESGVDVLYMTRLQRERMSECQAAFVNFNWYDMRLTPDMLDDLPRDAIVMHPMPRNDEIDPACDADPRCLYLTEQPRVGLKVRMALLDAILYWRDDYYGPERSRT